MSDGRRFEVPEGLSAEEIRAVLVALERYFLKESPHPDPWVLAGRVEATGQGALQTRRFTDEPWRANPYAQYARRGAPPLHGRGDAR